MDNKYLVIGSSGNIGSSVVVGLRVQQQPMLLAARQIEGIVSDDLATPIYFDFDNPDSWPPALEGVSRVFMIPKVGDPYPDKTLAPFIDAAVDAGVQRIVFSTAMGLDRDWRVLCVAEDHLAQSGLEYTILRPGWFMQNFTQGFLKPGIINGHIGLPSGSDCRLSFIDTRDIAAVAVNALRNDDLLGRKLTLTGPESLSWEDTARALSEASGHPVSYREIPEKQFRESMLSSGARPYRVEQTLQMMRGVREGLYQEVTEHVPDVLGRHACGLRAFLKEYKSLLD